MVVGSVIEFKDKSANPKNGLSHENKYMYLGKAKMKHPDTREWIKCAMYSDLCDPELVYVREWEEFIDKFQCCNLDLLN